jgi:hypothetical protein
LGAEFGRLARLAVVDFPVVSVSLRQMNVARPWPAMSSLGDFRPDG